MPPALPLPHSRAAIDGTLSPTEPLSSIHDRRACMFTCATAYQTPLASLQCCRARWSQSPWLDRRAHSCAATRSFGCSLNFRTPAGQERHFREHLSICTSLSLTVQLIHSFESLSAAAGPVGGLLYLTCTPSLTRPVAHVRHTSRWCLPLPFSARLYLLHTRKGLGRPLRHFWCLSIAGSDSIALPFGQCPLQASCRY